MAYADPTEEPVMPGYVRILLALAILLLPLSVVL